MDLNLHFEPKLVSSLRSYSKERFAADLMAGLIVSIVALPLAIAFGIASGVSPEEGLITAIVGGFFISALGGCSVQIGGPTGAFIVILSGVIAEFGIEGLLLATFMSGVLLVIMGVLKLGSMIRFIPYPIIVGFTSGIAITIFTSQVPDLFGISCNAALPSDFIGKWSVYISSFGSMTPLAFAFGVATIIITVLTPKISKRVPGSLVAIVIVTSVSVCLRKFMGIDFAETIGDRFTINASLPTPKMLEFSFQMVRDLFPAALTIAILCSIETLLSAAVADGVSGDRTDSNMEVVAIGVANIATPFFGGIPVTGAVARTMTNLNNGGRSPVAGIINAFVLLMILLFLGSLTGHIPMACLAGILAVVSWNMSEQKTFKRLLKGSHSDVLVLVTTFLLTIFFDLTVAIMVGLLMAMVLFIRRIMEVTQVSVVRSSLDLSHDGEVAHDDEVLDVAEGVEVYSIDGPFFFGVASKFDSVMAEIGERANVRVIRMRRVPFMDSTGVHNLEALVRSSQENGIKVILSGVLPDVRITLQRAGFEDLVGKDAICNNIQEALAKANAYSLSQS
ncbi:MAG: SulP family inorganic anion transporter [Rikenellaceae bacterium]